MKNYARTKGASSKTTFRTPSRIRVVPSLKKHYQRTVSRARHPRWGEGAAKRLTGF